MHFLFGDSISSLELNSLSHLYNIKNKYRILQKHSKLRNCANDYTELYANQMIPKYFFSIAMLKKKLYASIFLFF